jgi:putative FmdB family regulatory protein
MPIYEFSCPQGCEDFEIWRSIDQRTIDTECPACGTEGKRLFSPPVALCGPLRLKQESREPKVIRKNNNASEGKARLKNSEGARPWMLNRGC